MQAYEYKTHTHPAEIDTHIINVIVEGIGNDFKQLGKGLALQESSSLSSNDTSPCCLGVVWCMHHGKNGTNFKVDSWFGVFKLYY